MVEKKDWDKIGSEKIRNITMSMAIDAVAKLWVSTTKDWFGNEEEFIQAVHKTNDIMMKARKQ